nr:hypothetical protein GCM10010200_076160 [Actinomadura rugatobispora]
MLAINAPDASIPHRWPHERPPPQQQGVRVKWRTADGRSGNCVDGKGIKKCSKDFPEKRTERSATPAAGRPARDDRVPFTDVP